MKYLFAIIAFTVASHSFAAQTSDEASQHKSNTVESYHYGMAMDIAHVISMTNNDESGCGVVPASITYVDHQGVTHTIDYLKVSNLSRCDNG
ncbi:MULTISPECIES: DUF2790 domain-containing protein [Pseudomonas]|uniref:DUF2790 domain-containing protein n=1 Tax=Pseudomonas TaxID=286 RepID=UPI001EDF68E1